MNLLSTLKGSMMEGFFPASLQQLWFFSVRHSPWIPSSYMPTMPGKLFFLKELAGPLTADLN